MKTVVGLYDNIDNARQAIHDLLASGFSKDDLSLVTNDVAAAPSTVEEDPVVPTAPKAQGAGAGAFLGGLAGVEAGLIALAIPGIGPILAAGAVGIALAGAAAGAAAGSLLGVLTQSGIPDADAKFYDEAVRRGGTLVAVHAEDDAAQRAVTILDQRGSMDIDARLAQPKESGLSGFGGEGR